jgi:hypothetical protein
MGLLTTYCAILTHRSPIRHCGVPPIFFSTFFMKKSVIKLDKAFSLDKATIAKLSDAQMSTLAGGKGAAQDNEVAGNSCGFASCNTKTAEDA